MKWTIIKYAIWISLMALAGYSFHLSGVKDVSLWAGAMIITINQFAGAMSQHIFRR